MNYVLSLSFTGNTGLQTRLQHAPDGTYTVRSDQAEYEKQNEMQNLQRHLLKANWVWDLPELLHSLDLVSSFDFIAASARVGFEKPHRGIFDYALQQAGVAPEEAIHVGDHVDADVAGATALGIGAVLIDRHGHHPEVELPAGVPRITALTELLPIVDRRLAAA